MRVVFDSRYSKDRTLNKSDSRSIFKECTIKAVRVRVSKGKPRTKNRNDVKEQTGLIHIEIRLQSAVIFEKASQNLLRSSMPTISSLL
jgi:hypothetical protein